MKFQPNNFQFTATLYSSSVMNVCLFLVDFIRLCFVFCPPLCPPSHPSGGARSLSWCRCRPGSTSPERTEARSRSLKSKCNPLLNYFITNTSNSCPKENADLARSHSPRVSLWQQQPSVVVTYSRYTWAPVARDIFVLLRWSRST